MKRSRPLRLVQPYSHPDPRGYLQHLATLLDDRFRIPGTSVRFGLDSLIGLVPGIGDGITALISAYIIMRARRSGISRPVLMRMVANMVLDLGLGSVPLIGDLFDVGWKANKKNLNLLLHHLRQEAGNDPR